MEHRGDWWFLITNALILCAGGIMLGAACFLLIFKNMEDTYESRQVSKVNIIQEIVVTTEPAEGKEEDEEYEPPQVFKGYTNARMNVREEPSMLADVVDVLNWGTYVEGTMEGEWLRTDRGYLYREYLIESIEVVEYRVDTNDFKSWEPYIVDGKSAFGRRTKQHKLQKQADTDPWGLRVVGGRYCVALGSYFDVEIGQYFDLVLENGTIIQCVKGDAKDDKDTDEDNIISQNGCASEFIVDPNKLDYDAKYHGDISLIHDAWQSKIVLVKVYDEGAWSN